MRVFTYKYMCIPATNRIPEYEEWKNIESRIAEALSSAHDNAKYLGVLVKTAAPLYNGMLLLRGFVVCLFVLYFFVCVYICVCVFECITHVSECKGPHHPPGHSM